jgi:hypothetical protein
MATSLSPAAAVELRDPPPSPAVVPRFSTQTPPQIIFRHPAYRSTRLIDLPAFDGSESCPGLHHGTALLICGIIADNKFNGWLSRTRDGERLGLGSDGLLPVGEYYFHVPWPAGPGTEEQQGLYKYPVIPTFRHWAFPHDNLPPAWRLPRDRSPLRPFMPISLRSNAFQAAKVRDGGCCVSPNQDGVEGAHICPEGEDEWFREQEMDQYNPISWMTGAKPVNNPANMLTLRADIHIVFDAKSFVFTRKHGSWVWHFLTCTANLGSEYHNMRVKIPADVHPNFILARLAWAVFPMIQNFFSRGEPRLVRVALEQREMTSQELGDTFFSRGRNTSPTKSRSNSPQKRQRTATDNQYMETRGAISRRLRLEIDQRDQSVYPTSPPAAIPELVDFETNSEHSHMPGPPLEKRDHDALIQTHHIAALRHEALIAQRKKNANLMCCDYDAAEKAIAAGLEGPKLFGGAHLCVRCLGVEYQDEDE